MPESECVLCVCNACVRVCLYVCVHVCVDVRPLSRLIPQVVKGWDPVDLLGLVLDLMLSALLVAASAAAVMGALIGLNFIPSPSYEVRWRTNLLVPQKHQRFRNSSSRVSVFSLPQIYDAQMSAPARFFMLRRQEPPEVCTKSVPPLFLLCYPRCTGGAHYLSSRRAAQASANGENATIPGGPGRWELPPDASGFEVVLLLEHPFLS